LQGQYNAWSRRSGFVTLGLIVIGLLAAFALRRGPRA